MLIVVKEIPEGGLHLSFRSPEDGWFRQVLKEGLESLYKEGDRGRADFTLLKTGPNVNCTGSIHFDCHPTCDRCLKEFPSHHDIPLHLTLAPFEAEEEEEDLEEEKEFLQEDEEFSFYDGVEFNLADLIREQVILSLPMQSFCDENCQGLCQQCGQNLNEGVCGCEARHKGHRWASLKGFKAKN